MKVTTKNFQILKGEQTFEFPKGITILQGESATGKSSLIYAIKYALTNPSGVGYCINHDSKYAEVTIENNGNSVTWVKTATSSEYRNNKTGESFVKASKLTSKDIADLGFYFDPKGNCINLHDEWSVLFPFGLNDSELFKLFEDIFSISCSYQIVDDMKKDEQQVKTEINNLNANIDKQNAQITNIDNMLGILDKDIINKHISELQQKEQYLNQLKSDLNRLQQYIPYLSLQIPESFEVQPLLNKYNTLCSISLDVDKLNKCQVILNLTIPEHKDIVINENKYISDYKKYEELQKSIDVWTTQIQKFNDNEKLLQEKLSSIKVCPTCGRPLQNGEQCSND